MIQIANTASVFGLRPEMLIVVMVAQSAFNKAGVPAIITSAVDGRHGNGSHHYKGLALDFRTRHLPPSIGPQQIATDMRNCLGPEFQVVVEPTHIHVEYDPQQPAAPRSLK